MNNNKCILVTGGAGYIGSHTFVELVNAGYNPIIVDDFRNSSEIIIEGLSAIVGFTPTVITVDINDYNALEKVFEQYNFHGIIHFAADKAVGESVIDPLKYYGNNVCGMVTILKLALKYQVKNFIFSSSCTVYGEPKSKKEVSEDMAVDRGSSPYGQTKIIGEQILADLYSVNPELKIIALRYFNPVGAHPSGKIGELPLGVPNNLFPYIMQTATGQREQLIVFGDDYQTTDGTCIRDYIHVVDLADAHVKALRFAEKSSNGCLEFINVGTGKGVSVLEIIKVFEQTIGIPLNYTIGPRRSGDVAEIFANCDRAKNLLNWSAHYTIQEAISHAWQWEQNVLNYD